MIPNSQPKTRSRWTRWVVLCVLLILPALALRHLAAQASGPDWRIIAGVAVGMSLLALFLYWVDKRRAETQRWRIPELTLHLLELAGGWPGAFLAQGLLRHKNAKISYQIIFWLIVVLHLFAAFEILNGWRITRSILLAIGP